LYCIGAAIKGCLRTQYRGEYVDARAVGDRRRVIKRDLIISVIVRYEDKVGTSYSMHGRDQKCIRHFIQKVWTEELCVGVDGRLM
jgi:hypothetical protein